MIFERNEAQAHLAQSLDRFLARHSDGPQRRRDLVNRSGDQRVWRLAHEELDLPGLMIPAAFGGHDGGMEDAAVVMEGMGRRLGFDAFAEHAIVAPLMLHRLGADTLLGEIAQGRARVGLAFAEAGFGVSDETPVARSHRGGILIDGRAAMVCGGPAASHLILRACFESTPALFLIPANARGIERSDYILVDGRAASDFFFHSVSAPIPLARGDEAERVLQQAGLEGAALSCAEALGVMRQMLALTIVYLNSRRQFGAPLASFQALQHRIADMGLAVEKVDVMNACARVALADGDAASGIVAAASVVAGEALRFVAQSAVQLHGAMGTVEEAEISHYFRRATVLEMKFGGSPVNLECYTAWFAQSESAQS